VLRQVLPNEFHSMCKQIESNAANKPTDIFATYITKTYYSASKKGQPGRQAGPPQKSTDEAVEGILDNDDGRRKLYEALDDLDLSDDDAAAEAAAAAVAALAAVTADDDDDDDDDVDGVRVGVGGIDSPRAAASLQDEIKHRMQVQRVCDQLENKVSTYEDELKRLREQHQSLVEFLNDRNPTILREWKESRKENTKDNNPTD
jgi:hypothetical protein